jgi:uncharacterized protein DUF1440
MIRYESPLSVAIKGGIAGLAGTAVLTVAMKRVPVLMQELGLAPPDAPSSEAEADRSARQPTEDLAEKVASGVLEQPLEQDTKRMAGQAVHWGYGAGWGAVYGIVQASVRLPLLLHGSLFGSLVAIVASTLVPAMGLMPPPTRQPMAMNAMQFVFHLIYGWTTAVAFWILAKED